VSLELSRKVELSKGDKQSPLFSHLEGRGPEAISLSIEELGNFDEKKEKDKKADARAE
jgi:hypothetical protein